MSIRFDPSARHDGRLACAAGDFALLRSALAELVAEKGADVFARHCAAVTGNSRDPIVRTRWDSFWAARRRFPRDPETGAPTAFRNSLDSHISSALARLLPLETEGRRQ